MFRRVLVANRGEIAVRIIRACRDLGVSPVTVHSEADRDSLHVRLSDESVCIGPAAARSSYLAAGKILDAAEALGAEAVHPGYGFLAERADFAERCEARGLTFVGPSADAMRRMGDKAAAREAAIRAGVPVASGSPVCDTASEAVALAEAVGYPLLIKAAAGGGGMGMRPVAGPPELRGAFAEARSEAHAAFGDSRVFLERRILAPRHVEIQVFGDATGAVVHLGERECSIQRRNQKLVEESPSPALSPGLRERMGAAAVRLADAAGYRSAGTVEFLVDAEGQYSFLEMNTRLQVEHPITECVVGLDLVTLQLGLAAGAPLGFAQDDVTLEGAAIEMRITAEDPFAGFVPGTGTVREFRPADGPGVRCDAGIAAGSEVSSHYDPLLAKLITWGADRETARRRAIRAVRETRLVGIPNTLPFFERVLRSTPFRSGSYDTGFVGDHWTELAKEGPAPGAGPSDEELLAFAAAAAAAELQGSDRSPPAAAAGSRWSLAARPGAGVAR